MSKKIWNSIAPAIQEIIKELNVDTQRKMKELNPAITINDVKKLAFTEVYELSKDKLARWKKAVQPVVDKAMKEREDKGFPMGQVMEICNKYQ